MILTDGVHLVSNRSLSELHLFAQRMGLRRKWFQDKRLPHYDLTTVRAVQRAEQMGAKRVSGRKLVMQMIR